MSRKRLAVETANLLRDRNAEAPLIVGFTSLRDPELALAQIASRFGVKATDDPLRALVGGLSQRPFLLVLDNLKHMIKTRAGDRATPGFVSGTRDSCHQS